MISFVYFDLGGVVEKDFSATHKWDDVREELGIQPSQAYEAFWADVERDICTRKEVDSLLPILQEKFGAKIPNNYSLLDTFVKRFEKNESIWSVITTISQTARVGLFTMMYPHMLEAIQKSGILPQIEWDIVVDSSVVELTKSDKEMYELAEEKARVPKNEILYVENSRKYIEIAKDFGWQTFFYDSTNYEKASNDLVEFWRVVNK